MRLSAFLILTLVLATAAPAQPDDFPTAAEIPEIKDVAATESFTDPARLSETSSGRLMEAVGFKRYQRRVYSMAEASGGTLSIEIVTLLDRRAAFSLLTLLRDSAIQNGPPGEAFAVAPQRMLFAQDEILVRIRAASLTPDRLKELSLSISRKIGPRREKQLSLISRLPKPGYDPSSLRYYPGIQPFLAYPGRLTADTLGITSEAEIAEARYTLENHTGVLALLNFPTKEGAEEYYEHLSPPSRNGGNRLFARKVGPIVAVLHGPFSPDAAEKLLAEIRHSYSVKWIYEKPKPKTVWGVPVGILGTVVKSIWFSVILGAASIILGAAYAVIRVLLRHRASANDVKDQDQNNITRLRLP